MARTVVGCSRHSGATPLRVQANGALQRMVAGRHCCCESIERGLRGLHHMLRIDLAIRLDWYAANAAKLDVITTHRKVGPRIAERGWKASWRACFPLRSLQLRCRLPTRFGLCLQPKQQHKSASDKRQYWYAESTKTLLQQHRVVLHLGKIRRCFARI